MSAKKMVIFDYDGVIADSWELSDTTAKKLFPDLTKEAHLSRFEGNIFTTTLANTQRIHVEEFFTEYGKEIHTVEFFRIHDILRALREKYSLSIVTSTPGWMVKQLLEREKLIELFDDILGKDVHESKHEKIGMLLQKHGLEPKDCVMITDTLGDIREARLARVDSIGVSWGYHKVDRLEKEKTFRIIHEPKELLSAVEDYFVA